MPSRECRCLQTHSRTQSTARPLKRMDKRYRPIWFLSCLATTTILLQFLRFPNSSVLFNIHISWCKLEEWGPQVFTLTEMFAKTYTPLRGCVETICPTYSLNKPKSQGPTCQIQFWIYFGFELSNYRVASCDVNVTNESLRSLSPLTVAVCSTSILRCSLRKVLFFFLLYCFECGS